MTVSPQNDFVAIFITTHPPRIPPNTSLLHAKPPNNYRNREDWTGSLSTEDSSHDCSPQFGLQNTTSHLSSARSGVCTRWSLAAETPLNCCLLYDCEPKPAPAVGRSMSKIRAAILERNASDDRPPWPFSKYSFLLSSLTNFFPF